MSSKKGKSKSDDTVNHQSDSKVYCSGVVSILKAHGVIFSTSNINKQWRYYCQSKGSAKWIATCTRSSKKVSEDDAKFSMYVGIGGKISTAILIQHLIKELLTISIKHIKSDIDGLYELSATHFNNMIMVHKTLKKYYASIYNYEYNPDRQYHSDYDKCIDAYIKKLQSTNSIKQCKITKDGMNMLLFFVNSIIDDLMRCVLSIMEYSQKKTISEKMIYCAANILLDNSISASIDETTKCVLSHIPKAVKKDDINDDEDVVNDNDEDDEDDDDGDDEDSDDEDSNEDGDNSDQVNEKKINQKPSKKQSNSSKKCVDSRSDNDKDNEDVQETNDNQPLQKPKSGRKK
jgi:hypothetical protein